MVEIKSKVIVGERRIRVSERIVASDGEKVKVIVSLRRKEVIR
jgi:hypothetical protein